MGEDGFVDGDGLGANGPEAAKWVVSGSWRRTVGLAEAEATKVDVEESNSVRCVGLETKESTGQDVETLGGGGSTETDFTTILGEKVDDAMWTQANDPWMDGSQLVTYLRCCVKYLVGLDKRCTVRITVPLLQLLGPQEGTSGEACMYPKIGTLIRSSSYTALHNLPTQVGRWKARKGSSMQKAGVPFHSAPSGKLPDLANMNG
ncbi:hypothetical protein BGZ63DRAFT_465114 [Mariannaea sp. PMI_226]|nr:hypothetical protein BGZ63DRAFT_465114 [Mariannaea sp. PMI_226]